MCLTTFTVQLRSAVTHCTVVSVWAVILVRHCECNLYPATSATDPFQLFTCMIWQPYVLLLCPLTLLYGDCLVLHSDKLTSCTVWCTRYMSILIAL